MNIRFVLLALLLITSAESFSQDFEKLTRQALELVNKGEFEKAIPIALDAADEAYKYSGSEGKDYATALNNLGYLYEQTGKIALAETYYLGAYKIRKKKICLRRRGL